MTATQTLELIRKTVAACTQYMPSELALGWLRYEAVRKLTPKAFAELHRRNLTGERFDDLVDELVVKKETR